MIYTFIVFLHSAGLKVYLNVIEVLTATVYRAECGKEWNVVESVEPTTPSLVSEPRTLTPAAQKQILVLLLPPPFALLTHSFILSSRLSLCTTVSSRAGIRD